MLTTLAFAQVSIAALGMPCTDLTGLELERAEIASAEAVAAGIFVPPAGSGPPRAGAAPPPRPIPSHCRVKMVLKPNGTDLSLYR